eukprot:Skav206823  [mRNA]  locus=scaffold3672:35337:40454:+ [translate_table: standard]
MKNFKGPYVLLSAVVRDGILDATGEGSACIPMRDTVEDKESKEVRMGELFCGGFGGWAQAARSLSSPDREVVTRFALDKDPICSSVYRKSHQMHHVATSTSQCANYLGPQEEHCLMPDIVFQTEVESYWWVTFAWKIQAQLIAMSPPCPPWSNADRGLGLCKADGFIMLISVLLMCFLRPRMWMAENVSSMRTHQHWPIIAAAIRWAGFELVWSPCMDLAEHVPQHRDRLILLARNCRDEELDNHKPVSWPTAPKPTLDSYGVLMSLNGYWKSQSELTREEIMMYLDPRHAPHGQHGSSAKRVRQDVAQNRLKTGDDTIACVLTTYGRPHAVPDDVRNRGGLYGSLIQRGNTIRKLTLPELVILFGTIKPCWLPSQNDIATTLLGNAISVPHALIALLNALGFLRALWYGDNVQFTFASVCSEHLSRDNLVIYPEEDGWWFCKADQQEDEIAATVAMRCINYLTVESPLQSFQVSVEEGVCIRRMLHLLVGASLPPQMNLEVSGHKKVFIPLHDETTMPDVPLKVTTLNPSCLILHEEQMAASDWPFVVVLAPNQMVVLKRGVNIFPQDVEQAMLTIDEDGEDGSCHTIAGEVCNVTVPCVNVQFFYAPRGSFRTKCPEGVRVTRKHEYFVMTTHIDRVETVRTFLYENGLENIIRAVGWEMTMVCSCNPFTDDNKDVELRLTRAPDRLALQPQHFENVLRTMIFVSLLDLAVSNENEVTRVAIKLWSTWVWSRWVSTDSWLSFITNAWRCANGFFDEDGEMRLIHQGKMLNPDLRIRDYCNASDPGEIFKVHMVLQLRGGGPSQKRPLEDVRDDPTTLDEGEDGEFSRVVEIHDDYAGPSSYSHVSESVEDTVANRLKRMIELPVDDVYLHDHIMDGLTLLEEQNQMCMWGTIDKVMRFMEFCKRVGIEQVVNEMGWQQLVRFPDFKPHARVQMVIVPIPGVRCHPLTSIRGFMISAMTYCRMPAALPEHSSRIRVQVNLWGVIVVDGFFHPDTLAGNFSKPWLDVTTFADQPCEMRLIQRGKCMMPEFTLKDYLQENQTVMKIHMVLQLHGGGPPQGNRDKPDPLVKARNEVARILLDVGCDLQETTSAVSTLLKRAGLTPVNAALRKKDHASKITAIQELAQGTIPHKDNGNGDSKEMLLNDDWADYRMRNGMPMNGLTATASGSHAAGPATAPQPVRNTQGPIKDRFKQQDTQIDSLKQVVTELKQSVEQSQQENSAFKIGIEGKVLSFQSSMQSEMKRMGDSLEQSVENAMRRQDRQLNDSFRELKLLIQQRPEPKKKARVQKPHEQGEEEVEDDEALEDKNL